MEITFRTQNNIQVVTVSGVVGGAEAAAVRVKLEEKINHGRDKILFDFSNADLANDKSRQYLLSVVHYCVNRDTLVCCCGVQSQHQPLLLLEGGRQPKIFFTVNEGLDYLSKNEAPSKKNVKTETGRKSEEELKQEALQKLLEKYEVFQNSDEDDPFRLDFLAGQYRNSPNQEALTIEKKAWENFSALQEEIKSMDAECDALAGKTKSLMLLRKIPLSAKELQFKHDEVAKEIDEAKSAIAKLKQQIDEARAEVLAYKQKALETRASLDQTIREYEDKIKTTDEIYAKEINSLKAQDAKEQADFEAKMKS